MMTFWIYYDEGASGAELLNQQSAIKSKLPFGYSRKKSPGSGVDEVSIFDVNRWVMNGCMNVSFDEIMDEILKY